MSSTLTGRSAGLAHCHACALVSRMPTGSAMARCPRCSTALHIRKPNSVARTWALLVAAYVLYIPANLLPMMETRTLFGEQDDTILSGVVYLWQDGSWVLAAVVFVASIAVPLLKLLVLTLLAWSIQQRSLAKPMTRLRFYRAIEFIGRWSMLDIYVVSILAALVQIQSLARIQAGPAALSFGAVVVLTLLASHSLDPRLIWDPVDDAEPLPPKERTA